MKKRYVLYGHTISLLNKIIWLILDALMQKNAVKLPTTQKGENIPITQKNIPTTQMTLTYLQKYVIILIRGRPYIYKVIIEL